VALSDGFLFQGKRSSAARRALSPIAQLADIDLQFAQGAAERVAMHAQFACGAALIALVFLEDRQDKAFLEFPYGL